MSKLKKIAYKFGKVIPAFALVVGLSTVSQACVWWFYQPEIPEKLKKKLLEGNGVLHNLRSLRIYV